MKIKLKTLSLAVISLILAGLGLQGYSVTPGGKNDGTVQIDTARSIAPYFIPATTKKKTPNSDRNWSYYENKN
jgi:hypothetical protein